MVGGLATAGVPHGRHRRSVTGRSFSCCQGAGCPEHSPPERPSRCAPRPWNEGGARQKNERDAMGSRTTTRNVALVGPNGAGKTTLLESMLFVAGAIGRKGSVAGGTTVGDGSPEARARQ